MSKTFLIADDSLYIRNKLQKILQNANYSVVGTAENGMEAVKKFKELSPEVVLLDIVMPNMDGITTLRMIKAIKPDTIVLMISSLGTKAKVLECVKSGAKSFILKPFEDDAVLETISKICGPAE